MNAKSQPLVSVVTPVYNGDKYLVECIESVLAQTYQNWEYVIVNNSSTDHSLEIAQSYAQKDRRIRIVCTDKLLPIIENWNYALKQISAKSRYCKVVHADDWLFPNCLTEMVEVAETNSSVGIVGSYRLENDRVISGRIPYTRTIIPGRELGRMSMLVNVHPIGSPTTILVRSDLILERLTERNAFYNEENLHADTEVCYELLQEVDFGFVHQVLTFVRRHDESVTSSVVQKLNTDNLGQILILKKYGRSFLNPQEYEVRLKKRLNRHYIYLGQSILAKADKDYWEFQKQALKKLGYQFSWARVLGGLCIVIMSRLLNVKGMARSLAKLFQIPLNYRNAA